MLETCARERVARLSAGGVAWGLVRSVRPHQWLKNAALFGGLIFSPKLYDLVFWSRSLLAFVAFSCCSGACYLWNDVHDREVDRLHPTKALRPIASGEVALPAALVTALVLAIAGLWLAFSLELRCGVVASAYVAESFLYTVWLKRIPVVDVLTIACGFVLRVAAGVFVILDPLTPWIVLCTFFLALFLGFAKRRQELDVCSAIEPCPRQVLREYPAAFLDAMVLLHSALAIASYTMFTLVSHKTANLVLTVPFVVHCVVRYNLLLARRDATEDPTLLLIKDRQTLFACVAWLAASVALLRYRFDLFLS